MRKGFWDRQGANIASRQKENYGAKLFLRQNSDFGQRITHFCRDFVRSGGDSC